MEPRRRLAAGWPAAIHDAKMGLQGSAEGRSGLCPPRPRIWLPGLPDHAPPRKLSRESRAIHFCFALLVCWALSSSSFAASSEPPTGPAPTQVYAFHVNADGLLLNKAGKPVAVADVPAYLKSLQIPTITVVALWIDGPDAAKKLGPTIQAFGGSFTKIIVKQWAPSDRTGLLEFPNPAETVSR